MSTTTSSSTSSSSGTTTTTVAAQVKLTDGMVINGVSADGFVSWKGIPYAEPPIGPLRWRAPQPYSKAADTIIDGSKFGNDCPCKPPSFMAKGPSGGGPPGIFGMLGRLFGRGPPGPPPFGRGHCPPPPGGAPWGQRPPPPGGLPFGGRGGGGRFDIGPPGGGMGRRAQNTKSEDCLFLNVYSRDKRREELLPVMIWIHGGGFQMGSAAEFDGTRFLGASLNDVIVVTINYRLNMFGFLAGSEQLATENNVNFGIQDQHAAILWCKEHIGTFGGDANRMTVFGESAGAVSICIHMLHYKPEELGFQAAIIQSGGFPSFIHGDLRTMNSSKPIFDRLAVGVGCDPAAEDVIECMRTKSVEELFAVQIPSGVGGIPLFAPTKGGKFFAELPLDQLNKGDFTAVPTIIGLCSVEGIFFVRNAVSDDASFLEFMEKAYPGLSESQIQRIHDTYHPAQQFNNDAALAACVAQGDIMFSSASKKFTEKLAEKLKDQPDSVYAYRFAYQTRGAEIPATHADDIAFTFPSDSVTQNPAANQVSLALIDFWTSFAIYHRPVLTNPALISSHSAEQSGGGDGGGGGGGSGTSRKKQDWPAVSGENFQRLVLDIPVAELVIEPIQTDIEKQRCEFVIALDKEEAMASL